MEIPGKKCFVSKGFEFGTTSSPSLQGKIWETGTCAGLWDCLQIESFVLGLNIKQTKKRLLYAHILCQLMLFFFLFFVSITRISKE